VLIRSRWYLEEGFSFERILLGRFNVDSPIVRCWCHDIHCLVPAILFTCKTIATKSTSILYGENTFTFISWQENECATTIPSSAQLRRDCSDLFSNRDGKEEVPLFLRNVVFPAFLLKIGRANASLIQEFSFSALSVHLIRAQVPIIVGLARHNICRTSIMFRFVI